MAIHVVQTGDSLWNISSLYGITIERLVEVNGLAVECSHSRTCSLHPK